MLRHLLDGLADKLPGQCAVCRAWPAQPVCESCVSRFGQPRTRCRRCALPVPEGVAECGRCLREPPPLDTCHAAVVYGYPWSALITQFKFHGQPGWARTFAALMRSAESVQQAITQADFLVPMPLSRERLAERGFNQALLLARALAPPKARSDVLLRIRHTAAQTALDRRARLANVEGAFAVEPSLAGSLHGRHVVLIDDVMTSGASVFSAAAALRRAGVADVAAVVMARTEAPA